MDNILAIMSLILVLMLIGLIILVWWINKREWKKIRQLSEDGGEKILQPAKGRFLFSYHARSILLFVFCVTLLWVLQDEFPIIYIIDMFFILSWTPLCAYPYYSIVIFEDRFNGPTRWGWLWGRTEIKFEDIDKDKVLRQRLRRKLGITVIHSNTGQKILTVGLDDQQLGEILNLAM